MQAVLNKCGLYCRLGFCFDGPGMKKLTLFALLSLFSLGATAQPAADAITGIWLNPAKTGYVQIYTKNGEYFGKVVGAVDGNVDKDNSNPDPAKRGKSLLGQDVFKHFTYNGKGTWTGGSIYDPGKGKTYHSKMWLKGDDTLKLRGYIGISLFGRTEELTRASRSAKGVKQSALAAAKH